MATVVQPFRLRVLLIAVLLSVQLVTVVTLVVSMQRDATTALQSAGASTLGRFADRVDERTRHYLDAAESALSVGERLMRAGVLDADDENALTRYFTAELQSHRWLYGMAFGREDGSFTHVGRAAGGLRSTVAELADDGRRTFVHAAHEGGHEPVRAWRTRGERFDPRERPWYRQARESDGIAWSDPYPFHGTEVPGVSASLAIELPAPAGEGGSGVGVLAVGIDLRVLSSLVSAVPGAGRGSAVLIDAGRQVVAYSDAPRLEGAIVEGRMPALSSLDDRPLEHLLKRLGARGVPASEAPARAEIVTVDDRRHLALVRPFDAMPSFRHVDSPDTSGHWMLVAQVPFERYAAGIDERFARRLAAIVAMLTLSALLAIAAVIRFTRPVYRIHRDATLDGLTGACNRAEFERRANALAGGSGGGSGNGFGRELLRGRRRRWPPSVLIAFDLDGFKGINDAVGHAAGDAVLKIFVERLGRQLRKGDVVGRLGGDEFAVVLALDPAASDAETAERVERLRRAVVSEPVPFDGRSLRFGATAGFAHRLANESVSGTLERADRALVAGKAVAKNRSYPAGEDDRQCVSGAGAGAVAGPGATASGDRTIGAAASRALAQPSGRAANEPRSLSLRSQSTIPVVRRAR